MRDGRQKAGIRTNPEAELDKLHHPHEIVPGLLAFNITKQRIVDLCNAEFEDDVLETTKSYSAFNNALAGKETYAGIIQQIQDLDYAQRTRPGDYLPKEGPGDDLRSWMAQIAKAKWWYDTLDLEWGYDSLNSWFSGRVKNAPDELRQQVDEWWVRVQAAVASAHRWSDGKRRDKRTMGADSWDSWCLDLIEDGKSLEEVERAFIAEQEWLSRVYFHPDMIDLSDPRNPVAGEPSEFYLSFAQDHWDTMVGREFSHGISRTPPPFDDTPEIRIKQFGDRRHEEGPIERNTEIYGLYYKEKRWRYWNVKSRLVFWMSEIVEVSKDGETWREPNEREKKGWVSGFWDALVAREQCRPDACLYDQQVNEARFRVKTLENELKRLIPDIHDRQLDEVERKLEHARRDLDEQIANTHY